MSGPPDAIVIGAGPNGLVAANVLANAGWSVLVLEAQPEVGGAVRSDRELDPAFIHDTFSAFYPLGAGSPVIKSLDLEAHGLRWLRAPAVLGNPLPDGSWAVLHDDVDATCAGLDAHSAGDGDRWRELYDTWQSIGSPLVEALMTPFPPVKGGLRTLTKLPKVGGLSYVRSLLEPARRFVETQFSGEAARLLLAGNAGHSDIPLDAPGSGLMAILLAMLAQTVGFPVPEGGAGELTKAMARRLESLGGEIRCNAHVDAIRVRDRRAHAVVLSTGETLDVGRAVLADVIATRLYGGLVDWSDLPTRTRGDMGRSSSSTRPRSRSTGPWTGPCRGRHRPTRCPAPCTSRTRPASSSPHCSRSPSHTVPAEPFLLIGQMTTSDPSRSPAGTESMWAYTHVPQEIHDDAGGEGITGSWDHDDTERMADRIQRQIEKHARRTSHPRSRPGEF